MPWLSIGAVTMKMISSTSITSMYGTTLISPISLRSRACVPCSLRQSRLRPRGAAGSSDSSSMNVS
jgi:hypothetical protein